MPDDPYLSAELSYVFIRCMILLTGALRFIVTYCRDRIWDGQLPEEMQIWTQVPSAADADDAVIYHPRLQDEIQHLLQIISELRNWGGPWVPWAGSFDIWNDDGIDGGNTRGEESWSPGK